MGKLRPGPVALAAALTGLLALAAAGGAVAAAPSITPPKDIASAGHIVYCSDVSYPPEEFYQGATPAGSDIDIGTAIARAMGVQATFRNTGFDGIVAALLAHRCDAIISGMTDTAERRKQVGFVDYLNVGMSLMVKKGNPKHIDGLASLSGHSAAVEVGTLERAALVTENQALAKQHKAPIDIHVFAKDTDAATALATGRVDVYFADSPPVAYYVSKSPDTLAFAGGQIDAAPIGVAVRKDDPALHTAVAAAIHRLYADGSMKQILARWKMSAFALNQG
jgi:polar amino acid transport system substrate-binding protein